MSKWIFNEWQTQLIPDPRQWSRDFTLDSTKPLGLFTHIHKCGGNSVVRLLFSTGLSHHIYSLASPERPCQDRTNGVRLEHLADATLADATLADAFKFTFVRNPYDRAVSAWKFFQQFHEMEVEFVPFLQVVRDPTTADIVPAGKKKQLRLHTQPATHPSYRLAQKDFVGRLETFADDMQHILKTLGLPTDLPLHWRNRSEHTRYSDYYDAEALSLVEDIYGEDIETLGYSFGDDGRPIIG
jgi:chondroitin 4-sulfotransferase 11